MRMPKCWSASSSPTRQREGGAFACACAGSTTANRSRCGHICGRTAARSPRRGATCCRRDSRRMNGFPDAVETYLVRLPLDASGRADLRARLAERSYAGAADALRALHHLLAIDTSDGSANGDNPAFASVHERLALAYGAPRPAPGPV